MNISFHSFHGLSPNNHFYHRSIESLTGASKRTSETKYQQCRKEHKILYHLNVEFFIPFSVAGSYFLCATSENTQFSVEKSCPLIESSFYL